MEKRKIMEFVLETLINELDESIWKYEVSEESADIRIVMLDGKQFYIVCSEVAEEMDDINAPAASCPTIRNLYLGNLNPSIQEVSNPKYRKEMQMFDKAYKEIVRYIPSHLQDKFEEICRRKAGITGIEAENSFVNGFQSGARFMLEMLQKIPEVSCNEKV